MYLWITMENNVCIVYVRFYILCMYVWYVGKSICKILEIFKHCSADSFIKHLKYICMYIFVWNIKFINKYNYITIFVLSISRNSRHLSSEKNCLKLNLEFDIFSILKNVYVFRTCDGFSDFNFHKFQTTVFSHMKCLTVAIKWQRGISI